MECLCHECGHLTAGRQICELELLPASALLQSSGLLSCPQPKIAFNAYLYMSFLLCRLKLTESVLRMLRWVALPVSVCSCIKHGASMLVILP